MGWGGTGRGGVGWMSAAQPPSAHTPSHARLAYLQDKLLVEGYAREVMRTDPTVESSDAYSMAMEQVSQRV